MEEESTVRGTLEAFAVIMQHLYPDGPAIDLDKVIADAEVKTQEILRDHCNG